MELFGDRMFDVIALEKVLVSHNILHAVRKNQI